MSEGHSVYLPRQLRPKRLLPAVGGQTDTGASSPRVSAPPPNNTLVSPVANRPISNNKHVLCEPEGDVGINAISLSGMLNKQICSISKAHRSEAEGVPTICAYLLGYLEADGTVHLNQLDRGIVHNGHRLPTSVHGTDVIAPLYTGLSKGQFYEYIFRPGFMNKIAGFLSKGRGAETCGLYIDFVNIAFNVNISISAAPAVDILNLPFLLASIREKHCSTGSGGCKTKSQGCLVRTEQSSHYVYDTGYIQVPADAVWTETDSCSQKDTHQVYIASGAPWSLRVVQVTPANDYKSAVVKHSTVEPISGEYSIAVRLASMELVDTGGWSTSTARLLSPSMHAQGALETISSIAARSGISVIDRISAGPLLIHTPRDRPARYQPSPRLDRIAAIAQGIASADVGRPIKTEPRPVSADSTAPDNLPFTTEKDGDAMAKLLEEQRNIRILLEEHNSLMKTHVSQTQELMRLAHHQPSSQAITRRYLRMKGTHTPAITSGREGRPRIARAIEESEDASSTTIRRSNSLSEIIDGIKSFEVEGYEETEHLARNAHRRPLPYVAPLFANGYDGTATRDDISKADVPSSAGHATESTSRFVSPAPAGISGLVSRIHHIVGDSSDLAGAGRRVHQPFERPPPMPNVVRRPLAGESLRGSSKVTPTTRKYLDSLG